MSSSEESSSFSEDSTQESKKSDILSMELVNAPVKAAMSYGEHPLKTPCLPARSNDSIYSRNANISSPMDYLRYLEENKYVEYYRKIVNSDWNHTPPQVIVKVLIIFSACKTIAFILSKSLIILVVVGAIPVLTGQILKY